MSVELTPATHFTFSRGPLMTSPGVVEDTLIIHNRNDEPVIFKIKTTAAKHYYARPNLGRIEPGEQVKVSIVLIIKKHGPPSDARCKDKFLIQSAFNTLMDEKGADLAPLARTWHWLERKDPDAIYTHKIRCVYTTNDISGDPACVKTEKVDQASVSKGWDFKRILHQFHRQASSTS